MFSGKMETEPIPERVFSLYKTVEAKYNTAENKKQGISRSDLKDILEPRNKSTGATSYFSKILNTAMELKIVNEKDNMIVPAITDGSLKTMDGLRVLTIKKLDDYSENEFYRTTGAIIEMNDEIYKYFISDPKFISILNSTNGMSVDENSMRGWRFWAQFLGFGTYSNTRANMMFYPNSGIFIETVMKMLSLENGQYYQMTEFINNFNRYGKILQLDRHLEDRKLNMSYSNGLRMLNDAGVIELVSRNDEPINWHLYTSTDEFNEPVTGIYYRGNR